jgi:hypothetical protein
METIEENKIHEFGKFITPKKRRNFSELPKIYFIDEI